MLSNAVTLTATETDPSRSELTRACLGLLADGVSGRRIRARLDPAEFEVVVRAHDVDALLDQALLPLDLVVLVEDMSYLSRGGAVELLRNLRPALPLVFLSQTDDLAAVRKALRAGVQGFLSYASVDAGLAPTIKAVLAGQLSVPRSIRNPVSWGTLSVRERQVLELVAGGLTNAEIASRLFLSESTVKSHLSSSFRKLGVSSRAEATALMLDSPSMPGPGTTPSLEQVAGMWDEESRHQYRS